jgi:hypothetical protein
MDVVLASLLFVWSPTAEFLGQEEGRHIIDISPGDFVPRKADCMTEPLTCHPDRHLETEPCLGVEKGRDVVVISEILHKPTVFFRKFSYLFAKTDSGCVYNRQVRPEGLKKFDRARLKGCHLVVRRRDSVSLVIVALRLTALFHKCDDTEKC